MSRSNDRHSTSGNGCEECPLAVGRRGFLRDVAVTVAAALVAAGGRPSAALASLVTDIKPLRSRGALRTYPAPSTDTIMIDVENDVIIARSQGKVYAFSRRCPHKGARLVWRDSESRIFCPKHKARFDSGGEYASGRRSRNLDRYRIQLKAGEIVVDTDACYREDENAREWKSAFVLLG